MKKVGSQKLSMIHKTLHTCHRSTVSSCLRLGKNFKFRQTHFGFRKKNDEKPMTLSFDILSLLHARKRSSSCCCCRVIFGVPLCCN
mmetsp:Transcript_42381/g.68278  ORF Transcript_42381/g.68278 Transcript_42381/m.68278 type:complete len:86 (+) Transcript_42381:1902-2159(+)